MLADRRAGRRGWATRPLFVVDSTGNGTSARRAKEDRVLPFRYHRAEEGPMNPNTPELRQAIERPAIGPSRSPTRRPTSPPSSRQDRVTGDGSNLRHLPRQQVMSLKTGVGMPPGRT